MKQYIIYNDTSGEIKITYTTTAETWADVLDFVDVGEDYLEITNDPTLYIPELYYITTPSTTPTVASRPLISDDFSWNKTTITADNSDLATLGSNDLPADMDITVIPQFIDEITTQTVTTTDNTFSFKTEYEGEYVVEINYFPYQFYEQIITAS